MRRNISQIDKICNKFENAESARTSNLEGLRILNSIKDFKMTEVSNNDMKGSDVFENVISTRKCSDQTITKKSL